MEFGFWVSLQVSQSWRMGKRLLWRNSSWTNQGTK